MTILKPVSPSTDALAPSRASDQRAVDPAAMILLAEIAEAGSLTAAARNLGTTQPALSKQLKRLAVLFLSWTLLYAILPVPGDYATFKDLLWSGPVQALSLLQKSPLNFIFEGTNLPLWFLTALMCAYSILTFCVVTKTERYILPLSFAQRLRLDPDNDMFSQQPPSKACRL